MFVINYFIQPKFSNIFLLLSSLIFYAWGEPYLVFLMIISIIFNWLVGKGISEYRSNRKFFLTGGIFVNLFILGYYKYAGFFLESLNMLMKREIFRIPNISLPIGISFFTFQAISYIIDVYYDKTKEADKLVNVALYISFFPQLIAGPIVKYREINSQIEHRQITGDNITLGFRRFIYGLSKKVLISNILGKTADSIFSLNVITLSSKLAWVGALCYTFQIYYDFSGYSDMAIGLGKMFGFDIPENFKYPYLSRSIREFWRRWHISLSSWFREYVYIPLGGNRKGTVCTYINLIIVFFLTGLWHGASVSFIIWGLYHGFFSIVERIGLGKYLDKNNVISHIYTIGVVIFSWVIFRVEKLTDAFRFIKRMIFPWQYTSFDVSIWYYIDGATITAFFAAILGMGILQKYVPDSIEKKWKFSAIEVISCTGLLLLCLAAVISDTYNPFIYFQF